MTSNRVKLTDMLVRSAALPEGQGSLVLWDAEAPGFGLRLRSASRSFIVMYRPAGAGRSANSRRVKLGAVEAFSGVKEARRAAAAMLGKVAGGGDPAAERAKAKRRQKATVADLLDRYEMHLRRREYVACNMVMSVLRRGLQPYISRDVATLGGAELAGVSERLDRERKPAPRRPSGRGAPGS